MVGLVERPILELTTRRLIVQVPPVSSARRVLEYCVRNRAHLGPWEPPRPNEYYSLPFWRRQIAGSRDEFEAGASMRTVFMERDPDAADGGRGGRVVGIINVSQIVRGAFQAAIIGYSLDGESQGRGLMTEALEAVIDYGFNGLELHRVMANYRPENTRSGAVLERLGFAKEGYAKDYLFIDGAWRDHVLTSLVRSAWDASVAAKAETKGQAESQAAHGGAHPPHSIAQPAGQSAAQSGPKQAAK